MQSKRECFAFTCISCLLCLRLTKLKNSYSSHIVRAIIHTCFKSNKSSDGCTNSINFLDKQLKRSPHPNTAGRWIRLCVRQNLEDGNANRNVDVNWSKKCDKVGSCMSKTQLKFIDNWWKCMEPLRCHENRCCSSAQNSMKAD